jgi:uncharacterized LabA/DUF88 family protein
MDKAGASKRIAVLIDAENVSYKFIDEILDEVALYGRATIKRIYGDFTKSNMKGWNTVVNEYSLHQVTQLNYKSGKNSSDSVLIIDAMDILYGGNVESMCIVSSDSDFTRLVMRLGESGLEVIGMGEEKTAESFINACTTFKFLGNIDKPEHKEPSDTGDGRRKKPREEAERKLVQAPKKVIKAIRNAIDSLDADSDGYVMISLIGDVLHNRFPDFDPTIWGAKSKQLSAFLMQLEEFEVEGRKSNNPNAPNYHIRVRK